MISHFLGGAIHAVNELVIAANTAAEQELPEGLRQRIVDIDHDLNSLADAYLRHRIATILKGDSGPEWAQKSCLTRFDQIDALVELVEEYRT